MERACGTTVVAAVAVAGVLYLLMVAQTAVPLLVPPPEDLDPPLLFSPSS